MSTPRYEAILQIANDKDKSCCENKINLQPLEIYGRDIFDLKTMRKRLPKDVYKKLERTICHGERLSVEIADVVANAMKDWAIECGATHYTHWFQPMTGTTAEKHDAFITPTSDGQVINEFSGKTLISGEPDASSLPSGGIRSTFEARGYTAWDPSVPVFLMAGKHGQTLHIPTLFYSYSGEALDRKTPLLRSIKAVSDQAVRILRLFGSDAESVRPMIGCEQEYFLVDKRLAMLRQDITLTGRTLLGAPTPKGQEMEDHYFGATPARVMNFMQDVEMRLLALGIPVQTRHNEVAPGQFELAPLYEEANIATDHNMLIMNILRATALEHDYICLLHEKPFAGVNGSGKHNNWSLCDSDGNNLLNPGETPLTNAQFLVFLAACLRTVHLHSDALRLGTVGAGNDHRLGANEAPPAIISAYLGEELTDVIESIISNTTKTKGASKIEIGVSILPPLPKDTSDRNRTSPFAFTGNKFEFRAVGSSQSVAPVNIVLNTAMACALDDIANVLEAKVAKGMDITQALQEYLPELFKEHLPAVFNGNGYSQEWKEEAAKRGLPNLSDTVQALEVYNSAPVMKIFERTNVLSEREVLARQEILFETYVKTVLIESKVLSGMVKEIVLPVAYEAQSKLAELVLRTRELVGGKVYEEEVFASLRGHVEALNKAVAELETTRENAHEGDDIAAHARWVRDSIIPLMDKCRFHADSIEVMVDDSKWLLPRYAELLWIH